MAARQSKRTVVTLQEVMDEGSYSGDEYEDREEGNDLFNDVPLRQESQRRKKKQKAVNKIVLTRSTHLMSMKMSDTH